VSNSHWPRPLLQSSFQLVPTGCPCSSDRPPLVETGSTVAGQHRPWLTGRRNPIAGDPIDLWPGAERRTEARLRSGQAIAAGVVVGLGGVVIEVLRDCVVMKLQRVALECTGFEDETNSG
jgi:hypothetical protein